MSSHDVELVPGSAVSDLLGAERVQVQSAHHQAIDALGTGLVVVGRTAEGEIEAIEHTEAPIVGVQWHPEDPGAPAGQLAALLASLERVPAGVRVAA
jgi:putative glutamine amidotransferase